MEAGFGADGLVSRSRIAYLNLASQVQGLQQDTVGHSKGSCMPSTQPNVCLHTGLLPPHGSQGGRSSAPLHAVP